MQFKKCPFCYAPKNEFSDDASLNEALLKTEELINKNINVVTLCGSELLLYPYIDRIIKKLHENNMQIILYAGSNI